MTTEPRQLPRWRFLLPLLFQLGLIIAVPARGIYIQFAGQEIALQTIPVDPYDLLRGYSQTLRYSISRYETLKTLSGWETLVRQTNGEGGDVLPPGTRFYVVLQAPTEAMATIAPQPWRGIAVSRNLPENLPANQVAIAAQADNNWIDYGIESYYVPEDQQDAINAEITRLDASRPFVVALKVDDQGNAVPTSLWIEDQEYRF